MFAPSPPSLASGRAFTDILMELFMEEIKTAGHQHPPPASPYLPEAVQWHVYLKSSPLKSSPFRMLGRMVPSGGGVNGLRKM